MIDFDQLEEPIAARPVLCIDGEWDCLVDYFKNGKMVEIAMTVTGKRGRYRVSGRPHENRLSNIVTKRKGGNLTVTFRWANQNGWEGSGAWTLHGSGNCLDGSWLQDGMDGGPWRWSGLRVGALPPPSESPTAAPLLDLDGEWLCKCDAFKLGLLADMAMEIEVPDGWYAVDGDPVRYKLSDIACTRRGAVVEVTFRWRGKAGAQGSGTWVVKGVGSVMDGNWTQDGLTSGPWCWNCRRREQMPQPADSSEGSTDSTAAPSEPDAELPSLEGEWDCLCEHSEAGLAEIVLLHVQGRGGHFSLDGAKHTLSDMALSTSGGSVSLAFSWSCQEKGRAASGSGSWTLDASANRFEGEWCRDDSPDARWLWSGLRKHLAELPSREDTALAQALRGGPAGEPLPVARALDGEWACLCANFAGQQGSRGVHMTIKGTAGTYRAGSEEAASEISDITFQREAGYVLVSFCWAHYSGCTGRGAWVILHGEGYDILDGIWCKEGSAEEPWRWAAVREGAAAPKAPLGTGAAAPAWVEKLRAGEPQHLGFYGTSLTSGECTSGSWVRFVCDALKDAFPGHVTYTDCAQESAFSDWAVESLRERVLAAWPDVLFVEFAVNDALLKYRLSPMACRRNLCFILDVMKKARPGCECVLMTTNPSVDEHSEWRPRLSEYYHIYREVAWERSLLLVDSYLAWLRILIQDPAAFQSLVPDGLHPGLSGCRSVVAPAVFQALSLPYAAPAAGLATTQ